MTKFFIEIRPLYWGELPFAFAVCRESKECFQTIIEHGANPDIQDTNGNSVLHMCVIHNRQVRQSISFS
jgi:ankyrin repeat protein